MLRFPAIPSLFFLIAVLRPSYAFGLQNGRTRTAIFRVNGKLQRPTDFNPTRVQSSANDKFSSSSEHSSIKISQTAIAALTGFGSVTAAASLGLLPSDGGAPYTDALILRDMGSAIATTLLATIFVKVTTYASDEGYLEPRDSRKLVHTLSAPLFMLVWPLFSDAAGARFFAATVSMIKAVRLYSAGRGQGSEASLASAVSRTGNQEEALGGPFIYVVVMTAFVLTFWRDSPVSIVALSTLAIGDGLADVIGRRFGGNNKWPGLDKSVAGSLAFWIGSTIASVAMLHWMQFWGCLSLGIGLEDLVARVAFITFVSAAAELIPFGDDNITVALTAASLTSLLI